MNKRNTTQILEEYNRYLEQMLERDEDGILYMADLDNIQKYADENPHNCTREQLCIIYAMQYGYVLGRRDALRGI